MKLRFAILLADMLIPAVALGSDQAGPGISADEALAILRAGNARFVAGQSKHPHCDHARLVETAEKGQHPFATVIACSDSRVPVEILFDEGFGDLFVVRVAGNVCDADEAGSIEYGVEHLGTPLLVVLGHTSCGAVTAVATDARLHGNIPQLVDNIKPAVLTAQNEHPHLHGKDLVPAAIRANVWQSIEDLLGISPDTRELVKSGKLKIVGAIYDLHTGEVEWMGSHPRQDALLSRGARSRHAGDAGQPTSRPAELRSEIVGWKDAPAHKGDWGEMRFYFRGESRGTKDILVATAVVEPGKAVHRAHRHAEEEYLFVTEGEGVWHLDGKDSPARKADCLYVEPWVFHGLTNTGDTPLVFTVVRFNSKGIPLPPRPDDGKDER